MRAGFLHMHWLWDHAASKNRRVLCVLFVWLRSLPADPGRAFGRGRTALLPRIARLRHKYGVGVAPRGCARCQTSQRGPDGADDPAGARRKCASLCLPAHRRRPALPTLLIQGGAFRPSLNQQETIMTTTITIKTRLTALALAATAAFTSTTMLAGSASAGGGRALVVSHIPVGLRAPVVHPLVSRTPIVHALVSHTPVVPRTPNLHPPVWPPNRTPPGGPGGFGSGGDQYGEGSGGSSGGGTVSCWWNGSHCDGQEEGF